ncbi:MAG: hypothetical protein LBH20_01565 [Treponema sp.]|nr:hypothetical protein [Treponema sp.]
MMNTKIIRTLSAGILLVFSLFLLTCDMGYQQSKLTAGDAAEPVVTVQPQNGTYTIGDTAHPLSVTATVSDGGALSYQWYTANAEEWNAGGGEAIPGATGSSLILPEMEEGVHTLYVKITNTNNNKQGAKTKSVNSNLVTITINDPANAFYPVIDVQPESALYQWEVGLTVDPLSVTASVTDTGTLSYQWYSVDSFTNTGGTEIGGATLATYTPVITTDGSYYYYVAVTNTRADAPGRKESETLSLPAAVQALIVNATITVTNTKQQYIRGYGGMAIIWDNVPQDYLSDYEKMFNPDTGLGFNMLRIQIPSVSTDIEDGLQQLVRNQINSQDKSHYYDMVKLVNGYNGYVLASPWSPPAEWKSNGSTDGGGSAGNAVLLRQYWPFYSAYLAEYCRVMLRKGAPIYAVSIQNEPNFRAEYEGCEWEPATLMRDFFKQEGHFTDGIKGWGGGKETPYVLTMNGESANTTSINDPALDDPVSRAAIDVIGRHVYGNQQSRYEKAWNHPSFPNDKKEVWMTEHNLNSGAGQYDFDSTYNYIWKFMNDVDLVIRLNNENAFIWWTAKRFYSFIGDGSNSTNDGEILPRGYGLSHYAKFSIDTTRVDVTVSGTTAGGAPLGTNNVNNPTFNVDSTVAKVTAFVSQDGNSYSLVMFTPQSTSGTGGIDLGAVKIQLPAGFEISGAQAVRTTRDAMFRTEKVTVLQDKNSALVQLSAGQILSLKFTK